MANFPTKGSGLSQGESPSLYKSGYPDNVKKAPTDGGYEFRRRQFTRNPPRQIETGFISISHADFLTLDAFYLTHQKDTEFTYYDYMCGVSVNVRFDEYTPTPTSIGQNKMWNVKIKMSEL